MATLRDELLNDPLARGYAGMTDAEAVISLNTANRPRDRDSMLHREIADNIDAAEWTALSAADKSRILGVLGMGGDGINPFGIGASVFIDVFGGGSATITALAIARVELISRAMELGLRYNPVKVGQVEDARA